MEAEVAELNAALDAAKAESKIADDARKQDSVQQSEIQAQQLAEISALKIRLAETVRNSELECQEKEDFWRQEMVFVLFIFAFMFTSHCLAGCTYHSKTDIFFGDVHLRRHAHLDIF